MERETMETSSILIIEGPPSGDNPSISGLLSSAAEFRCESKTWDGLARDELRHCGAELVVPVSYLHPRRLKEFFEWWRTGPTDVSALAVMPSDADTELLELASETTQDFVLLPVRPAELYERVRRLVGTERCSANETRGRLVGERGLAQPVGRQSWVIRVV